jgi:hypothetical protein
MRRAVLEQQHPRQRPALPLLAMRAATVALRHQSRCLQREPRHGVAELVVMVLDEMLVKMLGVEIAVAFLEQPLHARELGCRRPPWRRLAEPAIAQALDPVRVVANAQPAERPPRHPQKLARFLRGETPLSVAAQCFLKSNHENLP